MVRPPSLDGSDVCGCVGMGELPPQARANEQIGPARDDPMETAIGKTGLSSPILEVQDVHRDFGGVKALDGATFRVRSGAITGLIGPNGAGKSTLVGVICGAVAPTSGRVMFCGEEVSGLAAHSRARLGLIRTFQLSSEFGRLTVLENLVVAGQSVGSESPFRAIVRGRRAWIREERALVATAREVLKRFDMAPKENEYASDLSGGQKRILELMRALMTAPKLLILDEPMAGVSPIMSRRIASHLEALREDGMTMLLIEHEMKLVQRLCDAVVVMAQGKVLAEGPVAEVRARQEVLNAYIVG
jgi:ABC-type branched-subunit amino acid transport system ATPase component